MLVADAFDAVTAETVVQKRRALQGLADGELGIRILLLQEIARAHRACGTARECRTRKPVAFAADLLDGVADRSAGNIVMPERIAHLFELVKDHHGRILAQFPGLVEDLLDVGLAAGRRDDLTCDLGEPIKTFLGHFRRKDRNGIARKQLRVEGAAAAIVAGGGPYGMVIRRIELTGHQTRDKAAERCADLVAAGGEPLAGQKHDARLHAGQRRGQLDVVDVAEFAVSAFFNRVVSPCDAEQVQRVYVPKTDSGQLILDLFGDLGRIFHLRKGRNDDVLLARAFDRTLEILTIHSQIDHVKTLLFRMD